MKRTKSSVDVSPQSRKDGSVEFSYDFVEDIEAQLNDTGTDDTRFILLYFFGCQVKIFWVKIS